RAPVAPGRKNRRKALRRPRALSSAAFPRRCAAWSHDANCTMSIFILTYSVLSISLLCLFGPVKEENEGGAQGAAGAGGKGHRQVGHDARPAGAARAGVGPREQAIAQRRTRTSTVRDEPRLT